MEGRLQEVKRSEKNPLDQKETGGKKRKIGDGVRDVVSSILNPD